MFLDKNQRVFVYEDNLWAVKGRFEAAMADDEEVEWSVLEDQFYLRLLIVCD
jgi:hypothetical protein